MAIDRTRLELAVVSLIKALGEDPTKPEYAQTPSRFSEAYAEFFSGLNVNPLDHLKDKVDVGDISDAVILTNLTVRSMCEHHLLPFLGVAHVAYLPDKSVVGLGKIPQVVNTLANRPQMQERLTEQIADTLVQGLDPRGVIVVIEAKHQCVAARGMEQTASNTITIASRGELTSPAARAEIMGLMGVTSP